MAPGSKRKRNHANLVDVEEPEPQPLFPQVLGWDAAFEATQNASKELVQTKGTKRKEKDEHLEFDEIIRTQTLEDYETERRARLKKERLRQEQLEQAANFKRRPKWKISEAIGGRLINADPVFTKDEKFLILATRSTINVYSSANSLLTTKITPKVDKTLRPHARIITYCLSPTNPEFIWVAYADGAIYYVNWMTGDGAEDHWILSAKGCIHMTVASMVSGGRRRDIVFTTERREDDEWRITANELAQPGSLLPTAAKTIYQSTQRVNFLKTANEGTVIVGAAGKSIVLGSLKSDEYETMDDIKYEFRVFESTDFISSLDVRCSVDVGATDNTRVKKGKKAKIPLPIVDVVVGDVKGAIFLHSDLLRNLVRRDNISDTSSISLIPRKLHWHRQTVQTVKWSLDGAYLISGGSETVLVLWQLDTGKHQFLPHVSSTIQSIVVSPSGTSYAVLLKENSAMIISTAELKATASVAGIQTCVLKYEHSIEFNVRRVKDEALAYPLFQRTPAAISPLDPSRLLLGVGQVHEIRPTRPLVVHNPFLQTFDLRSAQSVSRQALTRTNITNINVAPSTEQMTEPTVTHLKLSFDGKWLATVDEWTPSKSDLAHILHQGMDTADERWRRREVCLKFWQLGEGNLWELVSRINTPHSFGDTTGAGRVLDLAADPNSLRFSTLGDDEIVRTWVTKTRKRDNVVVRGADGNALKNWDCHQATSIGKLGLDDDDRFQENPPNGCIAFSEDGSILAAASGGNNDGLLHLLDPDMGTVRLSLNQMYNGDILKIEFLGQDIITLSDRVILYDIASDEMRMGFELSPEVTTLALSQKLEMLHLSVDPKSRTFAVVTPNHSGTERSLLTQYSELAVFTTEQRVPVLKQTFTTLITAILPAVGSEGYIVLDSAAEIYTLYKQGTQVVTALAQSTTALKLDKLDGEVGDPMEIDDELDDEEERIILPTASSTTALVEDSDDEDETPVVTQQQLSEIFDVGPSFALPPMEEMFYQVAELFLSPPLNA